MEDKRIVVIGAGRPRVNVGTVGHVDHGRVLLVDAHVGYTMRILVRPYEHGIQSVGRVGKGQRKSRQGKENRWR